jgi:hypothetical protein
MDNALAAQVRQRLAFVPRLLATQDEFSEQDGNDFFEAARWPWPPTPTCPGGQRWRPGLGRGCRPFER